jgi:hypothetical protein
MRVGRVACVLLLVFAGTVGVAKNSRVDLLDAIRARARSDVAAGRPHASVQDLAILFESKATAAGIDMGIVVDVYEAAWKKADDDRPIVEKLQNKIKAGGGWIAFTITALATIAYAAVNSGLAGALTKAANRICGSLAGLRVFRRISLLKYRRVVLAHYSLLKVPFRVNMQLRMADVYVPLRLKGSRDTALLDAQKCIRDHRRLMVVGAPGAGKSMLLKHVVYRYSTGTLDLPDAPIPILVELSRIRDPEASFEIFLVDAFERHGFPGASSFVRAALQSGTFMVLFDGFDEINTAKRNAFAVRLREFLELHQCRAIITCRSAVYQEQFATVVEETLEVAEFTDQQVWTFLTAWRPHLPLDKSIDRLMQALRDRPQIMTLARNPLLLTIVAFLYTESDFELPHSRAQFYLEAVDMLITRWNVAQNQYTAPQKKSVFRHLALTNQDSTSKDRNRRTMTLPALVTEVREVLGRLGLGVEHTDPIVREIVERTGILVMIDGGEQCQFAHLTLQEFFAADALREDPEGLLRRYAADPDTWREVVKLWCGLDVHSTRVIERVHEQDPLTAFECVVGAHEVDEALADRIIAGFLPSFGEGKRADEVVRAFAAAASESRARGRQVFELLEHAVKSQNPRKRAAAAAALALTNVPHAAAVLAGAARPGNEAYAAFSRMGDAAIASIEAAKKLGPTDRVTLLHAIGTPAAAASLVSWIWSETPLAIKAASSIASMFSVAGVEEKLRAVVLTEEQRNMPRADWVWKPFSEKDAPSLSIIANRIAHLILRGERDGLRFAFPVDPRLAAAMIVFHCEDLKPNEAVSRLPDRQFRELERLLAGDARKMKDEAVLKVAAAILPKPARSIMERVDRPFAADLTRRLLIGNRVPSMADWGNVLKPDHYAFARGWHFRTMLVVCGALSLLAAYGMLHAQQSAVLGTIELALLGVSWTLLLWPYKDPERRVEQFKLLFDWIPLVSRIPKADGLVAFLLFLVLMRSAIVVTAVLVFAIIGFLMLFPGGGPFVSLSLMLLFTLWYHGWRRERSARNPLQGLFKPA